VEITETLYVATRKDWRAWLRKHHKLKREIWLIYYRKETGQPRIPYDHAVEEALCFGWIDSTVKAMEGGRFAQRFTPRKAGRSYSQLNKERLEQLIANGKVAKHVLAGLGDLETENFKPSPGILRAIRANKTAWTHFRDFPDQYKRVRLAYIDSVRKRRPEEFAKRLRYFISMTEKNKRFGTGSK